MDNLARDPERFSQPQDDNTGETTLHILSKEGKVEIIETLLNDERMEDHMVSTVNFRFKHVRFKEVFRFREEFHCSQNFST